MAKPGLASLVAAWLLLGAVPGTAHEYKHGAILIDHPWARASAGPAPTGAAYVVLHNTGGEDRLVAAASERAERVEIHEHVMDGTIMRMRPVAGGLVLPAGKTVALE